MKVLRVNRAECAYCADVIESHHRHDFVECRCGAIFTDGGHDYVRRGGDPGAIIDHSVWEEMPDNGHTRVPFVNEADVTLAVLALHPETRINFEAETVEYARRLACRWENDCPAACPCFDVVVTFEDDA